MTEQEAQTLAYVLDGLEQWLEVERERGVRSVEVDRSLICETPKPAPARPSPLPAPAPVPASTPGASKAPAPVPTSSIAFLHDRPLTDAGREMMSKIVAAMGRTDATAPIVVEPPLPPARAYVVLGALALKKFFPGVRGEPGKWVKGPHGEDALVTYSPAFILRFPTMTDAVKKMKRDMWTSLKDLMRRYQ
jgi:hypothetical protein